MVENNKYGIVRYFESRGYDGYYNGSTTVSLTVRSSSKVNVKTKGIPSNSQDVIQSHAQAIEAYIHDHVGGEAQRPGEMGSMYFNTYI